MRAEDAVGRSVLPKGRKARALLALLALAAPRPLLRSHLISLLWSKRESNNALGSLRQSLHELQAALDTIPTRFFQNDRTRVAMRSEGLEVILTPADAFDRSILLEDLGGIDQALDLYLSTERAHLNQRSMSEAQATLSPAKEPPATLTLFDQPRPVVAEATTLVAPAAGSSQRMRIGISAFRASPGMLAPAFALGLTEELVLALEPFRWMSCVPLFLRSEDWGDTGAFRLLRNPELDCVIEGSVQEIGARLRIAMRVLDVPSGGEVVWAHRFDRSDDNPLLAQEEVAAEAAARIEARLQLWEARHAMGQSGPHPTVRGLLCASLTRLFRLDRAEFIKAGEQLEQALRLDPGNATTNVWLAQWHLFALGQGWAADPRSSTQRARDLARLALTLAPDDGQALALAGHVQAFVEKEPGEAMRLLDLAIEANPNAAIGWCRSAMASSYAGQHDIAVERAERARGMSSEHPLGFMFEGALAVPLLLRGDYEHAVTAGERSIALNPDFSSSFKTQLAALGHLGRKADADRIRVRLLRLEPGFSVAQAMERSPLRVAADRERYAEGLRLGGLR